MTIEENIMVVPRLLGWDKKQSRERARELMAMVQLDPNRLLTRYPRELSGGQQQRIAIARALALQPKVLLFDEPTSALDPELVSEVLSVIEELARSGTTLVIVTHELGFARRVADHVVMMDQGRVVEQGPPEVVFDRPRQPRTAEFLAKTL
jgi:polar amino acid transport system permease protein